MAAEAELEKLRDELDEIDNVIASQIANRFRVIRKIGALKKREGIPMMQQKRVSHVQRKYATRFLKEGLSKEFATKFSNSLIDEACAMELRIIQDGDSNGTEN